MDLREFQRYLARYRSRARERVDERMNLSDDTPWWQCVNEELLIDIIQRLERVEKFLEPEPEHERDS